MSIEAKNVAVGSLADMTSLNCMSALPPKADMCGATRDVRYGPTADILRRERDVRFTPKSGHSSDGLARPLSAKSGSRPYRIDLPGNLRVLLSSTPLLFRGVHSRRPAGDDA